MADPRMSQPNSRVSNLSPLMQATLRKSEGEVVNFCPFGCDNFALDELGNCGHMIGTYNGGQTFEPRVRDKRGRVFTCGAKRQPMKRGYKLVKITTSARVYSPDPVKSLVVNRDVINAVQDEIAMKERELLDMAEKIRNPSLEGDWETIYDAPSEPVAAK